MKKIRIGVFGCGRGASYFNIIQQNGGEIVAVCDFKEKLMMDAVKDLDPKPACYTDFEDFFLHDMDAVFLANYFHEHAPYAVRFLQKGIHVISECTSNGTMAEGVELVRAAEKSNAIYMLAENYPYMKTNQEMRRLYKSGNLGKFLFGEGEYNHPMDFDADWAASIRPFPEHWRNHNPASYYITHSLAPLLYITGAMPKRVTAMPVYAPLDEFKAVGTYQGDRAAIITCLNDDDSVYRVVGCSCFGGHGNAYRICGAKGQVENIRGMEETLMLRYNDWEIPEGADEKSCYEPEWNIEDKELAEKAGHGGGDFFVMKEFFDCIRTGKKPEFDVYFATTCASVAILAHRSMLEKGIPYDIPDFRLEADRVKYENDRETPFYYTDGRKPTLPCASNPDYKPSDEQYACYLKSIEKLN